LYPEPKIELENMNMQNVNNFQFSQHENFLPILNGESIRAMEECTLCTLEKGKIEDSERIYQIHTSAIKQLCSSHYGEKEISTWETKARNVYTFFGKRGYNCCKEKWNYSRFYSPYSAHQGNQYQ
jgi:hypothetical protein